MREFAEAARHLGSLVTGYPAEILRGGIKHAMGVQRYHVTAEAIGVSREDADRTLAESRQHVTEWEWWFDPIGDAERRLKLGVGSPDARPPIEVRRVARERLASMTTTAQRELTVPDAVAVAQLRRHIRLLVEPFTCPTSQRVRGEGTFWLTVDQPGLLDQLRDAASTPSGGTLTETVRRRTKDSHPPTAGNGLHTLSTLYVGISAWHARLNLPSPDRALDWQKAALRQLTRAADHRADMRATAVWLGLTDDHPDPLIAALARDVEHWWTAAARASGWRADDLRNAQ